MYIKHNVSNHHNFYHKVYRNAVSVFSPRGMNVLEAVTGFLRKVRELDTYGIQLYDVRYEESPCQLGITPGGISVFRRNRRIVFHDWEVVAEVSFKNKKLLVVLSPAGVCVVCIVGILYLH